MNQESTGKGAARDGDMAWHTRSRPSHSFMRVDDEVNIIRVALEISSQVGI